MDYTRNGLLSFHTGPNRISRARNGLVALILPCFVGLLPLAALAQLEDKSVKIVVKQGETIRGIAKDHLGDADLWQVILRHNKLASVTDVGPGTQLEIPSEHIFAANQALQETRDGIQRATQEGARLFAPDLIAKSIAQRDAALKRCQASDWQGCLDLADSARDAAQEALQLALAQRDSAAEALVSDRQGSVQGRKPSDLEWNELLLRAILIEEEKVRTLSNSSAQITFRDDSRLRLNADSQAVIRKMRADLLTKHQKAKVSLIKGDVYALLGGKSERKEFQLDVPGIKTDIESTNFWVSHEPQLSRFANYDKRKLSVTSVGETVTLGQDEGTLVNRGAKPRTSIDLLPGPGLTTPADERTLSQSNVELAWEATQSATAYWLEVATDPGFRRMVVNLQEIKATEHVASKLKPGVYYWRVAAIDAFGLPGAKSVVRRFNVQLDSKAPYLVIRVPRNNAIVRDAVLPISGETNPRTRLTLNGKPVKVSATGEFAIEFRLAEGVNELSVEAVGELDQVTRQLRSVLHMPDKTALVRYADTLPRTGPKQFVSPQAEFSLAGATLADADIRILTPADRPVASAVSDSDGNFAVNVPLRSEGGQVESFVLAVTSASGFTSRDEFTVALDQDPPVVEVDLLPATTARSQLTLRGRLGGAAKASLNAQSLALDDERFEHTLNLQPGINAVQIRAWDQAGNTSLKHWQVVLDQQAPELLDHDFTPRRASAGEKIIINVVGRDSSKLKQAAAFELQVGSTVYSGYLRLNRASQRYQGSLVLPPGAGGKVKLKSVELADYAGNRRRYALR